MASDDLLQGASPGGALSGERMLAAILNSLSEAVITVGRDHRIASFNRAAERLIGIPEGEALGIDCREVLRASFGPAQHDCPMGELGEGGKPRIDVEGTLVRADGVIIPVSASWAFFTSETDEVHGFVISFRSFEEIERIAEERKSKFPFRDIVGKTLRIRRIFDLVEVVKDTDSTVLITGESGTGKGLFARAIHDLSPRREKPFVKVNAAALTETLLESELFGHVKGAFTGAVADKVGRFEAADGGTIFLDEIGEISPALQVKLLRVLQDREFERVGSSRTQRADVRVIAATNRELKEEMRAGRFREDLFYRLNVIPLVVPPLRERREDIPLLVDHVLKSLRKRGLDRLRAVSPEAMRRLTEYSWPGNVRELENVLERGAVCSRGAVLGMEDIADEVREHGRARPKETTAVPAASLQATREEVSPRSTVDASTGEKDLRYRELEEHRGNKGAAAATPGGDRSTLWSRGAVSGREEIADEIRERDRAHPKETAAVPSVAGRESATAREEASRRFPDDAPTGEKDLLLRALDEHRWNKGAAAATLGIDRSTLWRKMKRLGIA